MICVHVGVSHHAAADGGAAQGVVLGEACATQLEREEVGDRRLANQGVKERLQCLIRLEDRTCSTLLSNCNTPNSSVFVRSVMTNNLKPNLVKTTSVYV